jgi:hypothetical protein
MTQLRPKVEVPSHLLQEAVSLLRFAGEKWLHGSAENCKALAEQLEPLLAVARIPKYHIEGRRWFQRSAGNTYHTVRIFENGELVHTSGRSYGYGEQFLDTAFAWLKANRELPPHEGHHMGTIYLREVLHGTYSVTDVDRERDL